MWIEVNECARNALVKLSLFPSLNSQMAVALSRQTCGSKAVLGVVRVRFSIPYSSGINVNAAPTPPLPSLHEVNDLVHSRSSEKRRKTKVTKAD